MERLPKVPDPGASYEIFGMNNKGWVVGAVDLVPNIQRAVVWLPTPEGYELVLLPPVGPSFYSNAYDVNESGVIVGESSIGLATWSRSADGVWTITGHGPWTGGEADINNAGQSLSAATY